MNVVAAQCGKEKHHPEWSNVCIASTPYTCELIIIGIQHNVHQMDYAFTARTLGEGYHNGSLL